MGNAYENYSKIRDLKGYTDYKVAKETGIGTATMSNWKNGKYTPKADKIQIIADFLGVSSEYLLTGHESGTEQYYHDEETAQMAQEIFGNKELRLLFSAARDASPEDLKTTHDMLMALKRKERGYNDDTRA